ncbi:phosphotransferase enzyme family-domain-containing protein [Chaetomium strumarium]|uniref:Phosphotransferase enzyme family-domain-containing protein n=1 Tax=Chaetomium strumarium TaxID=1170767 RepID=A0AAJ0GWZ9_9PEZI|nr:phosphotransferase enzyme family-domain-containing protein [Chaetomium strumarium]
MRDTTRDGLAWEDNGLGPEPRWTREPDMRAVRRVCRRHLGIADDAPDDALTVAFLTDGAFNKLYSIRSIRGQLVLRVSLPVDPRHKTRGEAAALQLVRRKTDIPVPRVLAFDDCRSNEVGFEWLLMERMPGTPAYYRWRKMTMAQKESLTVRVADFQSQLLRCNNGGDGFRGIGTLGSAPDRENTGAPEPGPVVSSFFFSGDRYHYPVSRGPFRSSHDWLQAQLNVIIKEHTTALVAARNDDDREYAESALRVARKLQRILHKVFPAIVHPPERTVVWHDDLSLRNILVDNSGSVTAVIGWECVSTMPRWVASQVPEFLRGAAREIRPDRNCYTDVDKASAAEGDPDDSLDNEGKTELYWIHLMEYEQTQLRKVYAARMRQLRPEWDLEVEEGALKVDFLGAVSRCGSGFYLRRIEQWVDAVERKEYLPLMEVLRVGIKKEKAAKSATSGALTLASRLS